MGNNPILSICIPTYNRAELLDYVLNGIFSQCNEDILQKIEVVISDNDSKDETWKIVDTYLTKYKYNLQYHKNLTNIWSNKNVIKVTEYAQWKYIRLLADDDCLTDFALEYVLDIIKKTDFDLMLAGVQFSENTNIKVNKKHNSFNVFNWIGEYILYLYDHNLSYQNLISFFSFYSIVIVKNSYFKKWLNSKKSFLWNTNNFPHDIIVYHNLKDKKIVIPNNAFVIGRILNESYGWSKKLISDLEDCMNTIEHNNDLQWNQKWKKIKNICIRGWKRTICLWILLKKLKINYKTNKFLKKIYYFYKKYLQ